MSTKKTIKKAPAKKAPAKKAVSKKTVKKASPSKTVKKVAKKAPAKKAVKKSPAKKKTTAKKAVSSKKVLVYADEPRAFWVSNGQVLDSLIALRDALEEMENEVYAYHAGDAHNDFARWVGEVLADNACATDLSKAKTPKTAKTVVVRHLKYYTT